jgi:hypothetical protein
MYIYSYKLLIDSTICSQFIVSVFLTSNLFRKSGTFQTIRIRLPSCNQPAGKGTAPCNGKEVRVKEVRESLLQGKGIGVNEVGDSLLQGKEVGVNEVEDSLLQGKGIRVK